MIGNFNDDWNGLMCWQCKQMLNNKLFNFLSVSCQLLKNSYKIGIAAKWSASRDRLFWQHMGWTPSLVRMVCSY